MENEDSRAQLEAKVERLRAEVESKSAIAPASSPPAKKQSNWIVLPWPLSRLIPGGSTSSEAQASWDSTDELTLLERRLKSKEDELMAMKAFQETRKAMEAEIKIAETAIKEKYAQANSLDMVIAMDCTGSMDAWIHAARDQVINIISCVKSEHPGAVIRVGFVAYRDFCDGNLRLEVKELTTDIEEVVRFIQRLRAFGGGDGPEDIPGGLQAAIDMAFTANAKCIVVVADYPCHGSEFHDSWDDDDYAQQIANSPSIKGQMKLLARTGIDFAFVQVQPHITSKMVAILREVYCSIRPPNGMDRSFMAVELDSALDVTKFADALVSRASSSLEASKSRSVVFVSNKSSAMSSFSSLFHYGSKSIMPSTALVSVAEVEEGEEVEDSCKECDEDSDVHVAPDELVTLEDEAKPLDWAAVESQPDLKAVRYTLHIRPGVEIDWGQLNMKHCAQSTTVRLAPNFFAKGAMRASHCMLDTKVGVRLVAKMYHGEARAASHMYAPNDVCMQVVAKYLAVQYSLNPNVEDAVDFISTCWYEITDPRYGSTPRVFTAEPFMEGQYVKYNNNTGWVNKKVPRLGERIFKVLAVSSQTRRFTPNPRLTHSEEAIWEWLVWGISWRPIVATASARL